MAKTDLTSLAMRWRVERESEAEFRVELVRHGLTVQSLMETLMHTYTSLPEEMKAQLAARIRDDGAEAAGLWLSETSIAGQWLNGHDTTQTSTLTTSGRHPLIISGTITEIESDPVDDDGIIATVDVGLKKPARRGKPTFFRIGFEHGKSETPTSEVDTFEPGDTVTIEAVDPTVRMVWEVDDLGRSSPVIRAAGNSITAGAAKRTGNHF